MKIAFLCNEYPPQPHGGIGTFVEAVTQGLAKRGHQITVVSLGKKNSIFSVGTIRVVTLATDRFPVLGNFITRLRLRKWLSKGARDGEIDLVEVPDYMGLLPFGVDGCPVVIRLHNTDTAIKKADGQVGGRGVRWYEHRTLAVNTRWIAVSRFIMELTQSTFHLSPTRSEVIYSPVPPSTKVPPEILTIHGDYILYAGVVSHSKGACILAEAMKPILFERDHLHLVYAGAHMSEAETSVSQEIIDHLGKALSSRVHFLGRVSREMVLALMTQARVFAFPSRFEALGMVVLEAMDNGVPVVCTSCPPGPEMVEDEVTGILADPESPLEFTAAIRRLLNDRDLAIRLATCAKRSVAERFSLDNCLDSTECFYCDTLTTWKTGKHVKSSFFDWPSFSSIRMLVNYLKI